MKAMTYQQATDTFSSKELPIPELETEFDVVVKVNFVGLNPVDAKVHLWKGMVADMDDCFVGGLDVSGEIVSLGAAVTDWKVGDKVLYHGNMRRSHGGFGQYAVQDCRTLVRHPDIIPEIAAATPCAAWTAYRALVDKLNIAKRCSIFIAGGAGGVGSFAIQIAKHFGVETIITTSSKVNHDYLRTLGATHVIDYRTEDVIERVQSITEHQGVEVALDCVGGENEQICAAVLGYEGQMVELVSTVNPTTYPNAFLQGLSFHQLSLGSGHVNGEAGYRSITQAGKAVNEMLQQNLLTLPKLEVISQDQIGDALHNMRNMRTVGKIVVRIEHES